MNKKWWKNSHTKKQVILKISKSVKASLKKRYSWETIFNGRYLVDKNNCFIYTGSLNEKGYGRTSFKGKVVGSHRLSYELKNGKINNSQILVCHSCNNPSCINPDHLWLGTNAENMNNMMSKNRGSISRLTIEDKQNIKNSYPEKSIIKLSVDYAVPTRVISFILKS